MADYVGCIAQMLEAAGNRVERVEPYRPGWYARDVGCPRCGSLLRVEGYNGTDGRFHEHPRLVTMRDDGRHLDTDVVEDVCSTGRGGVVEAVGTRITRTFAYFCPECGLPVTYEDAVIFDGKLPDYAYLDFVIRRSA